MNAPRMRFRLALFCALTSPLLFQSPVFADEQSSVEAGRSVARAILIFRDPWVCEMPLLSARCEADVRAVVGDRGDRIAKDIPGSGPRPFSGLNDFIEHGNRDGFDRALVYINTATAPDSMWATEPTEAALFDIGAIQVAIPAALDNTMLRVFASSGALDLQAHAKSGTLSAADSATVSSIGFGDPKKLMDAGTPSNSLIAASLARFPEPPLGAYRFDRPSAPALFGLTTSWVAEFIDNAPWIGQSDVDAFVTAWADQSVAFAPSAAPARNIFLSVLHASPFNHDRALKASVDVETAVLAALPKAEKRQVLFGAFAAQLAYNAAVLRDENSARLYLRVMADIDEVDPISPDIARLRATSATVKSDDWATQFALGRDLSVAILSASASP